MRTRVNTALRVKGPTPLKGTELVPKHGFFTTGELCLPSHSGDVGRRSKEMETGPERD